MRLVREADVAVVFGASLNQFTMRFGALFAPGTRVIQVDVAPAATHPHVGSYIRGDARLVAEALLAELDATGAGGTSGAGDATGTSGAGAAGAAGDATGTGGVGGPRRRPGWRESLQLAGLRAHEQGDGQAADGRLDPRSAAVRIAELLPDDRVVVSDGGHFIGWANMYWPVASPDRMLMVGTAYQSIGLGFPSVAGAALAHPESTVVLTTGDGGGLMALADLESAVRVAGGRGLAVVWNDAVYGAEVHVYGRKGLAELPMTIPEVDFAGLAAAVGAQGAVIRTLDDLEVLAEWARTPADERPYLLLDLRVSSAVVAPYQEEIYRVNR
jgi:thiamine pyrophosphate-dependent acetolactate synthase large subunit-like protein